MIEREQPRVAAWLDRLAAIGADPEPYLSDDLLSQIEGALGALEFGGAWRQIEHHCEIIDTTFMCENLGVPRVINTRRVQCRFIQRGRRDRFDVSP